MGELLIEVDLWIKFWEKVWEFVLQGGKGVYHLQVDQSIRIKQYDAIIIAAATWDDMTSDIDDMWDTSIPNMKGGIVKLRVESSQS